MDNLATALSKSGLRLVVAMDVRKYHTLSRMDDFVFYRDGIAKFKNCICTQNSSVHILRHDHSCNASDIIPSSPATFVKDVIDQSQSSRCSCDSIDPEIWTQCNDIFAGYSGPKLLLLLVCARSGNIEEYLKRARTAIDSGISIACVNIGGASNFSNVVSNGMYYYYNDVKQFLISVSVIQLRMIPPDKPTVSVRRIGSREICFDLLSNTKNLDCYIFEAASEEEGTFYYVGKTSTKTFYLKSTSKLEIKPSIKYSVKVALKLTDGRKSEFVEIDNIRTLRESPMIKKLRDPNLLVSEKVRMINLLKEKMIPEGVSIGLIYYNFLVFGDIGAGKSSFLNTVQTAFQNCGYYISDFPVGTSDKKSTTCRLSSKRLADNLRGTDVPGVDGENYDVEKITNLIEGNFPEKVELDEKGWSSKLLPLTERSLANIIHMAFFLVPIDCLLVSSVQEKYKKLRECFISYKQHNLTGIQPYLIITKGDTQDIPLKEDKKRIYDDTALFQQMAIFCKATGFSEHFTFFIANYLGGNEFEANPVVDYIALYIVTAALDQAKQNVRLLADATPLNKSSTSPSNSQVNTPSKSESLKLSNDPVELNVIQNGEVVGIITVRPETMLTEVREVIEDDELDIITPYIFFMQDKTIAQDKSLIKSIIGNSDIGLFIEVGQPSTNIVNIANKEIVGEVQGFDVNMPLASLRTLMTTEGIPDGWTNFRICTATGAPLTLKQEESRLIKDIMKDGNIFVKKK